MNFEQPEQNSPEQPTARSEKEIKKRFKLKDFLVVGSLIAASMAPIAYEWKKTIDDFSSEKYIEKTEKRRPLKPEQKKELEDDFVYLKKEFSPRVVPHLNTAEEKASEWNRQEKKKPLRISGFENLGMSNDQLNEIWDGKLYPKQWLDGNVQNIVFHPEAKHASSTYGHEEGYKSGEVGPFRHTVDLFAPPTQTPEDIQATKASIDWVFSHELGHLNDWINAPYLSAEGRVAFLTEITKAFEQPHSFRDVTGYVDSIKNDDKAFERYLKVTEWWATLAEYYFTFPDILLEQSPEDFALVDKRVIMRDPNFSPFKAHAERDKLLKKIIK